MIEWNSVRSAVRTNRRGTLHEELVARIGRMIQDGELLPGERISEPELCRLFEVSRTPLREALKVLASEGYVVWQANRGASVSRVHLEEVAAAFELLGGLERLIGEVVCARMTGSDLAELEAAHARMVGLHALGDRSEYFRLNQSIHGRLAALTRNPVIEDVYVSVQRRVYRARALSNVVQARWNESVREHERIMMALRARDPERLATELAAHSRATERVILQMLRQDAGTAACRTGQHDTAAGG